MRLLKVVRMFALAALALLFWARPQPMTAQGQTCETFNTLEEYCSDYSNFCDVPNNHINAIQTPNGPGRQTAQWTSVMCYADPGHTCGGFSDYTPVDNGDCCDGLPCEYDRDCTCAGYVCYNGSCQTQGD
jgi:hypothetical protein